MTDGVVQRGGRTRAWVVGAVALALVVAILGVVVGVRHWSGDSSGVPLARSVGAADAAPPVPLSAGQSYVRTEVLPSGDLEVTQWIESRRPLFHIRLEVPRISGTEGAVADHVIVVANGRVADGPTRLTRRGGSYSFRGASLVRVNYRLVGAVARSTSAPGRALAGVTALDTSYEPASTQVTRTVIAPEMLSMACSPKDASRAPVPCGSRSAEGEWTVGLTEARTDYRVLAQLTLGSTVGSSHRARPGLSGRQTGRAREASVRMTSAHPA